MNARSSPEPVSLAAIRTTFASLAGRASYFTEADIERFRGQICDLVRELKADGELPERIIVTIREAARAEGVGAAGERLVRQAVLWCLKEYFAEEPTKAP